MENGGGEEPLSSPPSSLSDMSPHRSDLATHPSSRDTSTFGVSAPQHLDASKNSALSATTTTTAPSSGTYLYQFTVSFCTLGYCDPFHAIQEILPSIIPRVA